MPFLPAFLILLSVLAAPGEIALSWELSWKYRFEYDAQNYHSMPEGGRLRQSISCLVHISVLEASEHGSHHEGEEARSLSCS